MKPGIKRRVAAATAATVIAASAFASIPKTASRVQRVAIREGTNQKPIERAEALLMELKQEARLGKGKWQQAGEELQTILNTGVSARKKILQFL